MKFTSGYNYVLTKPLGKWRYLCPCGLSDKNVKPDINCSTIRTQNFGLQMASREDGTDAYI